MNWIPASDLLGHQFLFDLETGLRVTWKPVSSSFGNWLAFDLEAGSQHIWKQAFDLIWMLASKCVRKWNAQPENIFKARVQRMQD